MSQSPPYPGDPRPAYTYSAADPRPANGLGIAGFVCSLVGLLSCGVFSPIGLLLSFIAIFREPRGFAIAGLILGALGSLWVAGVAILIGGAVIVALVAAVFAGAGIEAAFETFADGQKIREAIDEYAAAQGAPPVSLDQLTGLDPDALTDHWGRPYRYEVAPDGSWELASDGEDGVPGGGDDITFER